MKIREVGAIAAVLAMVVLAFFVGSRSYPTTIMVSTTRTVTLSSSNGSPAVIEEVIIQPEIINEICVNWYTATTSTAYLMATTSSVNSTSSGDQQATTTTTTETLSAVSTVTLYENITVVSNGSTCTGINPHYNATQSLSCMCA